MQDILVPIFGENGAIIVQYAITLAVVVALIALVIWGIRHFGGGATGPTVRGRLPRLAIVDTLAVDNKRKLVLLRRDNVEHLVLIGGPSDVVVEPSIVRQRVAQRSGQATAARTPSTATAAASHVSIPPVEEPAEAPPVEPPHVEPQPARHASVEVEAPEPPPLAARRASPAGAERAIPERTTRSFMPSRREPVRPSSARAASETVRSRHSDPLPAEAPAPPAQDPPESPSPTRHGRAERMASRFAPAPPAEATEPPPGPVPGYELVADDDGHDAVNAFAPRAYDEEQGAGPEPDESARGNGAIELSGAPPTADSGPAEDADETENVNELELEMARLLGQISTSRQEQG